MMDLVQPEVLLLSEEQQWLANAAKQHQSILEIGTFLGGSAAILARACPGSVVTVDPYRITRLPGGGWRSVDDKKSRVLHRAVADTLAGYRNVTVVRATSAGYARESGDRTFEMVWIDGDHTKDAVLTDLRLWAPRCTHLLCGHDLDNPAVGSSVREALEAFGLPFRRAVQHIWSIEMGRTA